MKLMYSATRRTQPRVARDGCLRRLCSPCSPGLDIGCNSDNVQRALLVYRNFLTDRTTSNSPCNTRHRYWQVVVLQYGHTIQLKMNPVASPHRRRRGRPRRLCSPCSPGLDIRCNSDNIERTPQLVHLVYRDSFLTRCSKSIAAGNTRYRYRQVGKHESHYEHTIGLKMKPLRNKRGQRKLPKQTWWSSSW